MELEEWLVVYQALTWSAGGKERSYWTIAGAFLLANCVLIFPLSLFLFSYTMWEGRYFATVLAGLGVLICLSWAASQQRAASEASHLASLLRSIEGQFAGSEFHRSLHKVYAGEEVCIPSTSWRCREWQPEAMHFGFLTRHASRVFIGIIPFVFLIAWVALAVSAWLI